MTEQNDAFNNPNESDTENNCSGGEGFSKDELSQIEQTGTITSAKGKHIIHCLSIIGQIEGHQELPSPAKTTKYEHLMPQLVAVEEAEDIEGLIILLNTVGGDVEAGLALAELIAGMTTPTVSLVLGGGHSIGVPLAVSAKHSFIVPSATMTIHPVRMSGLVLGVPQTMTYFEKMQERITRFVAANSRMTAERFNELSCRTGELVMDIGTVLDGQQAVEEGLIDEIGSLSCAIKRLYTMIESASVPSKAHTEEHWKEGISDDYVAAVVSGAVDRLSYLR